MNNLNKLTTGEAALVGGFFGSMIVFAVAFYVLLVVALWRIFTKAGEKGWKSLIPVYNIVCAYRIVGMSGWWVLASFVVTFLTSFAYNMVLKDRDIKNEAVAKEVIQNGWVILGCIVSAVLSIYLNIRFAINLARVFKKSGWFALGIILFPNIFTLILGFGSAKYDKKALKK